MDAILLHRLNDNRPIWLNPCHVTGWEYAYGSDVYAEVWVGGTSGIRTVETPEEVGAAWTEAMP